MSVCLAAYAACGVLRASALARPRSALKFPSRCIFSSRSITSGAPAMIPIPWNFEPNLTDAEFQTIGRFACRWAMIDNTLANCLRAILKMEPEEATVMIFPLTQDIRMQRIEALSKLHIMNQDQIALFLELKPLIRAMQFLRTTVLHGIADSQTGDFLLRSKLRRVGKDELFQCEDLINYAAHVTLAFRFALGDAGKAWPPVPYALPDRPPIPDFLPNDCRAFPARSKGGPPIRPEPSRG
jgi:hypothetical protein